MILLVEDEPLIREIMLESLQDAGFGVVEAADGDAAVRLIHDAPGRFGLLVTDFHMPGRSDGLAVAAAMRSRWPEVPVVIASGRPDVFDATWTTRLGYHLLRKPYRPRDLIQLAATLV